MKKFRFFIFFIFASLCLFTNAGSVLIDFEGMQQINQTANIDLDNPAIAIAAKSQIEIDDYFNFNIKLNSDHYGSPGVNLDYLIITNIDNGSKHLVFDTEKRLSQTLNKGSLAYQSTSSPGRYKPHINYRF